MCRFGMLYLGTKDRGCRKRTPTASPAWPLPADGLGVLGARRGRGHRLGARLNERQAPAARSRRGRRRSPRARRRRRGSRDRSPRCRRSGSGCGSARSRCAGWWRRKRSRSASWARRGRRAAR
uniref:Uncharacterized protein n=1 Tax=Arundo donax TaxID=35708 RepID=A0A0A9GEQ8_ARUDO